MRFEGQGIVTVNYKEWQFPVEVHGEGVEYPGAWDEPADVDVDITEIINPETGYPVSDRLSAYVRRHYRDECERAVWESIQ